MAEIGGDLADKPDQVVFCGVMAPLPLAVLAGSPDVRIEAVSGLADQVLLSLDILVVKVSATTAETETAALRRAVGPDLYVCVQIEGETGPELLCSAIAAGADDAWESDKASEASVVFSRARRALTVRRALQNRAKVGRAFHLETQTALDNLPTPVFFKDRAGIYRGCNKAFEAFVGRPSSDIIGKSVFDITKGDYAQAYYDADETLMRSGGTLIYEAKVCYAHGGARDVSFHKAATRDPETGEVNGLAGAMLDITVRRELESKLKIAAECDPLTGAFNRRKFFAVASDEETAARTSGAAFSILAIDVDQFKQINDRFGHACGDAALCHIVEVCQSALGEEHVFARSGGEEFFALLRNCELEKAAGIADTLRQMLAASRFCFDGQSLGVEVSIGVASFEPSESLSQTILRADHALYEAKERGRNRIALAHAEAMPFERARGIASAALRR